MKRLRTQHLLIVLAAVVAVFALANGYGLWVLLLACPLSMMFMHRGMGHDHRSHTTNVEETGSADRHVH